MPLYFTQKFVRIRLIYETLAIFMQPPDWSHDSSDHAVWPGTLHVGRERSAPASKGVRGLVFARGDDTFGNPHRAQTSQFEFFELKLSIRALRTYPLVAVGQTAPRRAILGNGTSLISTLPLSYVWRAMHWGTYRKTNRRSCTILYICIYIYIYI